MAHRLRPSGAVRLATWSPGRLRLPPRRCLALSREERDERAYVASGEETWIRHAPPRLQPYLRLSRMDRPIGTWLLLWPGCWSIGMAAEAGALPDAGVLAAFGVGALLMRGAGCTVNDMWDRDIDRKVARTVGRPLASGELSGRQGLGWLALQLGGSFCVLLTLQPAAVVLGAASLGLVGAYPLAKRVTRFPQVVLGLTFNWGALLGWVAVQGQLESGLAVVAPLYAGSIAWTLLYDTVYAHQDREDDKLLGLGSTALHLGEGATMRRWLSGFGVAAVGGIGAAGYAAELGSPFYFALGASAAHMAWQARGTDLEDPLDCMAKFRSNHWLGAGIFGGICVSKLVA